jgi:hypothetical protein
VDRPANAEPGLSKVSKKYWIFLNEFLLDIFVKTKYGDNIFFVFFLILIDLD